MKYADAINKLVSLEKEAHSFGFDWPNYKVILEQIISECKEVQEAIMQKEGEGRIQEEMGDLLHAVIALCVFSSFDVEDTLVKVSMKFERRIEALKAITADHGLLSLQGQSPEFMLQLWEDVKSHEKKYS